MICRRARHVIDRTWRSAPIFFHLPLDVATRAATPTIAAVRMRTKSGLLASPRLTAISSRYGHFRLLPLLPGMFSK